MGQDKELLKPDEVAGILKISRNLLSKLRDRGEGPPAVVISARVIRYRRVDVEEWVEEKRDVQPMSLPTLVAGLRKPRGQRQRTSRRFGRYRTCSDQEEDASATKIERSSRAI